MNNIKARIILASVVTAACGNAGALTGNEFLASAEGNDFDKAMAIGFVKGVYAGQQNMAMFAKAYPDHFGLKVIPCFPGNVTAGQAQSVMVKYLQENPERRHEDAYLIAYWAFASAWPCPAK